MSTATQLDRITARVEALPFDEMMAAADRAADTIARFLQAVLPVADLEPAISGLEAKYYVRAGFGITAAELDELLGALLAGDGYETAWLPRDARARVAAAAMRGWTDFHGQPDAPALLCWHRPLGAVSVSVGRASVAA